MRWLRTTAGWAGRSTVKAAAVIERGLSLVPAWFAQVAWQFSSTYPELAARAYGSNAVVYACMRLLCQSVAEPPLIAATEAADGELNPLPTTHPLQMLIDRPNELMTQFEMLELIELHTGLAGASYWWKQRANGGQVSALWPLRPDRVLPAYQPDLNAPEGERLLRGWWYFPPGEGRPIMLPRSEVVPFGSPNPAGETGGIVESLGWVQVLATEVAADNEASSFVGSLLANYAQPSMLIKVKQPIRDVEIARRLKAQFMSELGGSHKGEPALLDADTEIEKLSFDLKQLEFPDLRAVTESRVSAAAGVPAILVGLKVGLDKATYSNFESSREFFTETTLSARWRRYSDQFTNDLAPEFGPNLVIRFDTTQVKALAGQRQRHAQPIKEGFAEGVVLVDEYREKVLGLPPLPNGQGQVLYVKNTITVTKPEELLEEQPDPPALPPPPPQNALPVPADDEDEEPTEEADDPEARRSVTVKALADDVQRRADTTRDRHEAALLPQVRDALEQQRERVVSRWNEAARAIPDPDHLIPDDDGEVLKTDLMDRLSALFEDAYSDASVTLDVGISFDLENEWVRGELDAVGERIRGINQTTRDGLRDLIGRAASEGMSITEIAQEIRQSWLWSESRAETIARTETAMAYSAASIRAYEESGLVSDVEVLDGDYDAVCQGLNGQRKSLDWARANLIQHPRCLPAGSMVVAPNVQATFTRWFDGEVVVLRTAANDLLTCTPNHPVLTDRGWVAAGELRQGDYVVRSLDSQRIALTVDPDHDHVPTRIEQVADTLWPARCGTSATVPTTTEDFHGDGIDGDICVIRTDRFDQHWGQSVFPQHRGQLDIERGRIRLGQLPPDGFATQVIEGLRNAAHAAVRGFRQSASAISAGASQALSHSLGSVGLLPDGAQPVASGRLVDREADSDLLSRHPTDSIDARMLVAASGLAHHESKASEVTRQGGAADPDTGRELIAGLAGLVAPVQVVEVNRREFSGHVYNLETAQGWYIADGIITHNCRRAFAPIVKA